MRARFAAAICLSVVVACGSSAQPAAHRLPPGTVQQTVTWAGYLRTYLLHRPEGLPSDRHPPLVVVLHGASLTADQTERYYHWDGLADAKGFAVAYPQGIANAWNAGSCCGDAPDRGTDDIGFVGAVLADATQTSGADPSRRYLTGVSNGAMMALRYQCERPGRVAAIGSVAGTLTARCDQPPPVAFIAIHGLNDDVVSFTPSSTTAESGPNMRIPAIEMVGRFLVANGCADPVTTSAGAVHTERASCRPGLDVEVITIDGAGHQWPGAVIDPVRLARDGAHDQPSPALDATAALWSFFAAHGG